MKHFLGLLFFLFSTTSFAQLALNPAPVSGDIQITASQMYIYFTNNSSSAITTNLTVDSNASGVSIGSNRCASINAQQTCYIIISFSNYGKSVADVSVGLKNNSSLLGTLKYAALNPPPEVSNFSVSSLSMNDFNTYTITIKNNTSSTKSYNPLFSGTDDYRYVITLNRCQNIAPKATCQISLKLNKQFAGNYSASLSEPQVSGSIALSSNITNATVGVIPPPVTSITVAPSPTINFGTLTKLGQSASQVVTITNNGNTNVSPVISVEGSGLNILLNRCNAIVIPTKSCTVTLYFNAVNLMQNGVQADLIFNAKATNAAPNIATPVSVTLNIPPHLLISVPASTTNPPYLSGLFSLGGSKGARISSGNFLYMTGGLNTIGVGYSSYTLDENQAPPSTQFKFVSLSQNSDYFCSISTSNETFCNDPYGGGYSYYSPDLSGMGGQYFKEALPGFMEFDFCGITNSNRVYCWGNNDYGNLGDGSAIPPSPEFSFSNVPVEIKMNGALAGKTIKKLVAGVLTKCVLASDDKVYCWGYGESGEIGNGANLTVNEPTQINMSGALAGKTIKDISSASNGFCVIASDNKVYCWGSNAGNLTATSLNGTSNVPLQVVDTNNVLNGKTLNVIASGISHVCVIANDNKIYCWGSNDGGELGRGTSGLNSILPPAQVDMLNFAGKTPNSLSSGFRTSCATTTDNSFFCWGENDDNQLGLSSGDRLVPTLVP